MATPGQLQMYNKLETGEMFSLDHRAYDDRLKKIHRIHVKPDEKVPDACVFVIWLEDHTIGNLLRMEMLRNENVLFVGYKVPHPLDHMMEIRVQTLPKSSPELAMRRAIANIKWEARSMLQQFDQGIAALRQSAADPPPPPDARMDAGDQGMSSDAGMRSTSEERELSASPEVEERDQRFQEQLEEFERMAAATSTSFSPSYSPSQAAPEAPPTAQRDMDLELTD